MRIFGWVISWSFVIARERKRSVSELASSPGVQQALMSGEAHFRKHRGKRYDGRKRGKP